MTLTWQEFWNKKQHIYVSPRHTEVYYKTLGRGVLSFLPTRRPISLLDWGCGDALASVPLRDSGVQVFLYDPIPYVYERIKARFSGERNIYVLSEEDLSSVKPQSIDTVLIFSVLQYVSKDEFKNILPKLRNILVPEGMLLLGDIVPPSVLMIRDVFDLLRSGLQYGFFVDAVVGVTATFFSDYRSIRRTRGFTTYREEEILELLRTHGFGATRVFPNIGLSKQRMLIRAVKTKN